jgi:hypothetical protein
MQPEEGRCVSAGEPAEPWQSFLRDVDDALKGAVELRCLGGFVVTQHYGIGRTTSDIDFLAVTRGSSEDDLEVLAGAGSDLYHEYGLYLRYVGVVTQPCNYADRLCRMFPSAPWKRLTLLAMDATDLALSKVERNAERDREDFLGVVRAGLIDLEAFKERYHDITRSFVPTC